MAQSRSFPSASQAGGARVPWTGTERCCSSHYSIRLHDRAHVHHNTHDLRKRHRLPSQITVTKRIHHQSLSSPYHPPYLPKPSLPLQLAVFQKRENEQGSRVFHTDSVQDNIDSWGQLLSWCVIPASSWIQHHSPQVIVKRGVITHLLARNSNQFFMCF